MNSLRAQEYLSPVEAHIQRTASHLLLHMACVLLNELSESNVVCAKPAESIQDTSLTGVKKREVLGNLEEERQS